MPQITSFGVADRRQLAPRDIRHLPLDERAISHMSPPAGRLWCRGPETVCERLMRIVRCQEARRLRLPDRSGHLAVLEQPGLLLRILELLNLR